ncbi:MCE family protein [Pseudonocardia sp. GCM10023141]|uniref:MCE family protein n=1 Tax=Pseudonocardia sp. GCM10023141 TaxID=3252653 RepID=UPI0036078874
MITRRPVPLAVIGIVVILVVVLLAMNGPKLFGGGRSYQAEFSEAAGLTSGALVTIAGVEAGRVDSVKLAGNKVLVGFTVSDAWVGDQTSASIDIKTLLGSKYLALAPQGSNELDPGTPIPLSRTASPFDVVEAFNGLSQTVGDLNTDQLSTSLTTLADTFRGTPPEIRGALDGLSRLSTTIAGRDDQIKQLLSGTHSLSTVLADRNAEFEKLLSDGNLLLGELQSRKDAISALLDGTRSLSVQLRGLVADNRDQLGSTLAQLDRVAALLQRNRDSIDTGVERLALFARVFTNALGNGRWFDNYICGLLPPPVGPINPGGC